ncbi:MAG: bifunctional glutamate N-acetyltransferase/amino-acid acetyltransferase ArgJ [Candidatus Omnitrophota bacterium]|nr:bifunctional glutamate N-acetyltransferase/amino-acid acetyltransferase ArgJ [Candidatus Omnitrophota bacterium]
MIVPAGFSLWGAHSGVKKQALDLGIIYCEGDFFRGVGSFTKNVNPAYSVVLSKKNINKPIKAVLVNSGNANCFSHPRGLADTTQIISQLAVKLGVKKDNILIASTGIIGRRLPKEKVIAGFGLLLDNVSRKRGKQKEGIDKFANSILTTDTFEKISYAKVNFGKKQINILGIAKGSGMICPDMATLLGFVMTDADVSAADLKRILKTAVDDSFNSITVDGCMSTNDTVLLLSSKKVKLTKDELSGFSSGVKRVCLDLAKMMVKDAEGATKFVEIEVKGAASVKEAKKGGLFIANSNLFKCALYGANPNWGRIIGALGHAGIKVKDNVSIKFTPLEKREIKVTVDLKKGSFKHKVYTSDLTPAYVKINADYS